MNEFQKCKNDPVYFINTYVKLDNLERPIKLYDHQEKLIQQYQLNKFTICTAPRGSGKTIVGIAYILHYMLFNYGVSVGMVSATQAMARQKLNKLKEMYRNLPKWLRCGVIKDTDSLLVLGNYSLAMMERYSNSPLSDSSYDLIFIDQFSSIDKKFLNFWNINSPRVFSRRTTKIIVVSTDFSKEDNCPWVDSLSLAPVEVKIDLIFKQANPVYKVNSTLSAADREPYGFYSHHLPSLVKDTPETKNKETENPISFYDFVRSHKDNIPEKISFYEFVRSKE
jgi:hypothetical protein